MLLKDPAYLLIKPDAAVQFLKVPDYHLTDPDSAVNAFKGTGLSFNQTGYSC